MILSQDVFRRERIYTSTMLQARKLLKQHLISHEKYCEINTKMKEKYRPISDGLLVENELLSKE